MFLLSLNDHALSDACTLWRCLVLSVVCCGYDVGCVFIIDVAHWVCAVRQIQLTSFTPDYHRRRGMGQVQFLVNLRFAEMGGR